MTDTELNALIAERVMGWERRKKVSIDRHKRVWRDQDAAHRCDWSPSTDIADALEALDMWSETPYRTAHITRFTNPAPGTAVELKDYKKSLAYIQDSSLARAISLALAEAVGR